MRFFGLIIICACLLSCKYEPDLNEILENAYKVHGGKEAWDALESLSYEKESTVFDADSSVRFQSLQQHYYQLSPQFQANIQWTQNGHEHEIYYTDAAAEKRVGGIRVNDAAVEASAYESVNAARYTVSQPFKLSDPGVELTYEGKDTLEDGEPVFVVKATYSTENENHSVNDEWWYYFDVGTYRCLATMVHHGQTYSYIKNLSFDESTGFVLHHHRKGYAVDSLRNVLYYQSEYFYRGYHIRP